jgi:hypothetical protein
MPKSRSQSKHNPTLNVPICLILKGFLTNTDVDKDINNARELNMDISQKHMDRFLVTGLTYTQDSLFQI